MFVKYNYVINDQQETRKNIKIEVESVVEENKTFVTVTRRGSIFSLKRTQIIRVEKSGDKIYITIPVDVYEENFKR